MKRYVWSISIFLIGLILGIIFAYFLSKQNILTKNILTKNPKETPVSKINKTTIILPPDISSDFTLIKAQTVFFGENKEEFFVAGFTPINYSPEKTDNLKSFLVIYKKTTEGFSPVYKFSPLFPKDIEQTRISFEDMWEIKTTKTGGTAILTTWSQTGADYFGKYPIVIIYQTNTFAAVPFYLEDISNDPKLKNIIWTNKDVIVKNSYDETNYVLTILTQKVAVENNEIILSFFGDNECRACRHKYVTFKFPVEL